MGLLAALLAACGPVASSSSPTAATASPRTWEQPGLGGAVRPEMGSPQPGEPAPELTLPDLEGRSVSLAALRGHWVVIHFTATWCPFCDTEVSHLNELAEAYAPRGVRTLIVAVEEPAATWHGYASKRVRPSVVALLDASGASTAKFAPPRAQPSFEDRAQAVLDSTLIIDPEGKIRLFQLPDSAHFDPTFRGVRTELDRLVPEPVVAVRAELTPGDAIAVTLRIASGYHVMSDTPTEPTYVPTRITIEPSDGISLGEPRYPAPSAFSLAGRSIATFSGTVTVRVPITTGAAASAERRMRGTVRYQACTETRCLFPETRAFDVTTPASTSSTPDSPRPESSRRSP